MKRTIWGSVLLVLVPCLGWAQRPEASWDSLKQLRVGEKIEVVDMKLKSLKGTFVSYSEEALTLRVRKDDVSLPRVDIHRVGFKGGKRGRNTLIGLATGAGLGAGVGALGGKLYGEYVASFTVLGTLLGAGAGTAVGAAFPEYTTVYRAEKLRRSTGP